MAHPLVVSDEVYRPLAEEAQRLGLSPDGLLARLLETRYAGPPMATMQPPPVTEGHALDAYRDVLTEEEFAFIAEFTGTWEAAPGLDPVELVRSHDD